MLPQKTPELEHQKLIENALVQKRGRPPKNKVLSDTPGAIAARERRAATATPSDESVRFKSLKEENVALKNQVSILLQVLAKAYDI